MKQTIDQAQRSAEIELRALLSSTEDLLQAVGDRGGDTVSELRTQLTTTIANIRQELGKSLGSAADTADSFVSRRPWTALAIGTTAGLGLGYLLATSRDLWR